MLEAMLLLFIVFGSILFLIYFIISSIKSKELSKGWLKFLTCFIGVPILVCLVVFMQLSGSSPTDEDLGGLIVLVIFINNLISMFGLYLFYTLYYWRLNKNNNEVNYKKPFQIFLIVAFILVIFIYLLLF